MGEHRNGIRPGWTSWTWLAAASALVAAVSVPNAISATPGQEPSLEDQQQGVRQRQGEVALEVNALEAESAEIDAAMATISANVAAQQSQLTSATRAADAARTALAEADVAVADAQTRVQMLDAAADALVVQAYVFPPADNAWDLLEAESISDASVMQAVLRLQSHSDADVLASLEQARDDLQVERDNRSVASAEADQAQAGAQAQLGELQAALEQQAAFAMEAQAALEHKLAEAASLAQVDSQLSAQIAAEAAERARQAEEARLAAEAAAGEALGAPPIVGGVTPGPDGLSTVSCHTGGSITVANSLAGNLQAMLDAAAADGVYLCGGGFRDPEAQIRLRREHCGTSYYAIYQMPASQCIPPTARPGTSMHEQGLAIDFSNCSSRGSACFQWLSDHAGGYGLINLPSEPWHWSVNGR